MSTPTLPICDALTVRLGVSLEAVEDLKRAIGRGNDLAAASLTADLSHNLAEMQALLALPGYRSGKEVRS